MSNSVLRGSAPLTNTDYTTKLPSPCRAKDHTSDSVVEVMSLTWEVTADPNDRVGSIKDFTLTWEPQPSHESATVTCSGPVRIVTEMETGL